MGFFEDVERAFAIVADLPNIIYNALKDFGNSIVDFVMTPIDYIEDFFNSIAEEVENIIKKIGEFPKKVMKVFEDIADALEDAMESIGDVLMAPMRGIDDMITNFKRLVCMFKSIPNRIDNIIVGLGAVFEGIGEQITLYAEAVGMGAESTGTLLDYSFKYLGEYLKCVMKFLGNFYKCFFYYLLDLIGKILYLPIMLGLWIGYTFIGIDGYPIEKNVWEGFETFDQFIYSLLGFHVIHFPKSIRKDCYTCIRLRKQVVDAQARETHKVFKVDIPNHVHRNEKRGIGKLRKAERHFDEVSAFPQARPANKVK